MSKLEFKHEDFRVVEENLSHGLIKRYDVAAVVSQIAQAKFDKWLSEQPVVFSDVEGPWYQYPDKKPDAQDTHTARLVDIQEIKKECVEHVPKVKSAQILGEVNPEIQILTGCSIVCHVCGIKLKAKWEPV